MIHKGNFERLVARYVTTVVAVASAAGCGPSVANVPATDGLAQLAELRAEVERLSQKVVVLKEQLQQEQSYAARARLATQQQHDLIVALESQLSAPATELNRASPRASPRASVAATIEVEAELRRTYRALMRAIERLHISAEEKAILKNNLRPSRTLDSDNPWSSAQK